MNLFALLALILVFCANLFATKVWLCFGREFVVVLRRNLWIFVNLRAKIHGFCEFKSNLKQKIHSEIRLKTRNSPLKFALLKAKIHGENEMIFKPKPALKREKFTLLRHLL